MSTITYNCNIGSLIGNTSAKTGTGKTGASVRVLICASLAVAITSLTAQVIGSATSAASVAAGISAASLSQPAQVYSAAPLQAAAALPAITVAAAR